MGAYGAGGLFRTKLHGRLVWCAQKSIEEDGRRRYIRGYGSTPAQATDRRDANFRRYVKYGNARAPRMTLSRAVKAWAETKTDAKSREYRTQMLHSIADHWIARIGDMRLADITKAKAQAAHDDIDATKGFAAARNARKHLITLMNYALAQDWITTNPLAGWKGKMYRPAVQQTDDERADMRIAQFARFLEWLRVGHDDFYYVGIAFSLGLRPAEICGLELDSLRVGHAPKGQAKPLDLMIDREYSQSTHAISPWTKGYASTRTIHLSEGQASIFGEWMLKRQTLSVPEDWAKNQLFPRRWTGRGGAWHGRNRNALWNEWNVKLHAFIMDFAAQNKMTVSEERYRNYYYYRPHFNRHLSATALAEAGVPLTVAKSVIGHMSEHMTEHYTHVLEGAKINAVDALDKQFLHPKMNIG
jgi:site-specific recombinase XerC